MKATVLTIATLAVLLACNQLVKEKPNEDAPHHPIRAEHPEKSLRSPGESHPRAEAKNGIPHHDRRGRSAGAADPQASQLRPTHLYEEASAKIQTIADEDNLCIKYWGGPCTRIAHYALQCSDPRLREWFDASAWEHWCMDGKVERHIEGRLPGPKGATSVEAQRSVNRNSINPQKFAAMYSAQSGVSEHTERGSRSLLRTPDVGDPAALSFEGPQAFTFHLAEVGDTFCLRLGAYGECHYPQPAIPGTFYFAYRGRLTHVTLLPCADDRVQDFIFSGEPNVYCENAGKVERWNADDADLLGPMATLRVFSTAERIARER